LEAKKKLSTEIKKKAIELGFDACGITSATLPKNQIQHFRNWIENDNHGQMDYMEKNVEKRVDPSKLVENAKSVVLVLLSYFKNIEYPDTLKVSKYAQGVDYHYIIKEKLNQLLLFIQENADEINGRCFVDSAPVLERTLAQQAGLGWFGKNSMLLNKSLGSFFFIGEVILDVELEYDLPFEKEFCGDCELCLRNCPTGAIVSPKVVDARKCISYLTIEKRGEFVPVEAEMLNNWIFGCDICQNVCPWNKKAKQTQEELLFKYYNQLKLTKSEWLSLTGNQFKQKYKSSPLQRAGLKQIVRNVLGNDYFTLYQV